MRKPALLRAAIAAAFPDLARDPDRLRVWIDNGSIAARFAVLPSWEYRYQLSVLLLDFAGDPNRLMLAIVDWLRVEQPELLQNHDTGNEAVKYRVDVLDSDCVDILLELELTEAIRCTPRQAGGFDLIVSPEPPVQDPGFLGVEPPVPLSQIFVQGEQVLPPAPLDPPPA